MVILLDVDGVMVPFRQGQRPELLGDGFMKFSEASTAALQWLIRQTSADIVLTTTHRVSHSLESWRALLLTRGISAVGISKINEANSLDQVGRRADEVSAWAAQNLQVPFVILDDDTSLHGLPPRLKQCWVHCPSHKGLTMDLAQRALEILRSAALDS